MGEFSSVRLVELGVCIFSQREALPQLTTSTPVHEELIIY
jgi:hypothetical protein